MLDVFQIVVVYPYETRPQSVACLSTSQVELSMDEKRTNVRFFEISRGV